MDFFRYTCFAGNQQMSRKAMRKATVYLPLMLRTFLTQITQNFIVPKLFVLFSDLIIETPNHLRIFLRLPTAYGG
jgi:hypothetical protein